MRKEHLQRCQVATPEDIVQLVWRTALEQRPDLKSPRTLDLGAGDARFAFGGRFKEYIGVEVDLTKAPSRPLPKGARIEYGDAMDLTRTDFDLCIGNPPYVRHHNLDPIWRAKVLDQFKAQAQLELKQSANAFVLFLAQALLHTKSDGLVVQLIPFEWVTRPSSLELRDYIKAQGWGVTVCRFKESVFPSVLTTASITIIDKKSQDHEWKFFEIDERGKKTPLDHATGGKKVLAYESKGTARYAIRGLSPGGQDIFVLTEQERLFFQLKIQTDVQRCTTSLRHLPEEVETLNSDSFRKHYIEAGKRCWLIRSDRDEMSPQLKSYLQWVGERWKVYTTCANRAVWWRYRPHLTPSLLFASGFVGKTPKMVVNEAKAVAAGSVYGIIIPNSTQIQQVTKKLRQYNFADRVVSHSNNLKKVEVKQLNAVLSSFIVTQK